MADAMHVFISNTACFRPTKTARLTMLWPMLSSSILGKPGNRRDILIIEAVARVQLEAGRNGRRGGGAQQLELTVAVRTPAGVGVTPRCETPRPLRPARRRPRPAPGRDR